MAVFIKAPRQDSETREDQYNLLGLLPDVIYLALIQDLYYLF